MIALLALASCIAVAPAPAATRQLRRYPTFFAFYVGREDPTFVADNERLDRELTAARVPHLFALYAGGHENSLWQAHATRWLGLALDHLQDPERS